MKPENNGRLFREDHAGRYHRFSDNYHPVKRRTCTNRSQDKAGELIGRELASNLGVPFGIVEMMGVEKIGAPGSTAALALLIDAVKKGGAMASGNVGGLSGTFIPVSEDSCMNEAVGVGALSIEKLEALTSVCSVGLDMIAIP